VADEFERNGRRGCSAADIEDLARFLQCLSARDVRYKVLIDNA
jgi:hypothetical protein